MTMKLYLLQEREDNKIKTYIGDYDEYDGFVVRAKNEQSARKLAEAMGGRDWLNPEIVSCTVLSTRGVEEVVLDSYNAG